MSRAQGLPTNCDDDHAKYLSIKSARVGVGWTPVCAIRSLEIVPSNGAKDERQGRAVIDRMNPSLRSGQALDN
jgi:hypothetical protein